MNAELQTRPDKSDQSRLAALRQALDQGTRRQVGRLVNALHPAEIASLLESLPPAQREIVWDLVDPEFEGEVLVELAEEVRASLIRDMEPEELVAAAEDLELDDLAILVRDLPETVHQQILRSLDSQDRERLGAVLSWEEGTAGSLMNPDLVSVRPDVTLETVLRYLRMRGEIPEKTDVLFVVNRRDRYLGILPLTTLLTADPERTVGELVDAEVEGIAPETSAHEVAGLFQDRDLVSAPVIDGDGRLLGRITIDDVVDVIRDEADHSVMSMAGLNEEEDMFAPVVPSARRRGLWLGINLATAFLAAWVVGLFEATIEKSRCAGGADADRCEHGRRGRHPDAHADGARHGARPGRAGERPLAAGQGARGRSAERAGVGDRGRDRGLPVVPRAAHRRRHLWRVDREPAGRGDSPASRCRCC